jgi:ADP-ribose pyrophosphatase
MTDPSKRLEVLRDTKFSVDRVEVPRRDGGTEARHFIRHPGACVIVPYLPDGRLVLIRQYRPAIDRWLVELPAGTLDAAEAPRTCAKRELEEETGYRAGRMDHIASFFLCPGISDERQHVFLARDLEESIQHLDPTERIEVLRVSEPELRRRLDAGEIADAKTLAALHAVWRTGSRDEAPAEPSR